MSDVINSIFGRAQNETPSSGGYGYGTTETVEATAPAAETTEAEDTTVGEVADVDATEEDATEPESDEAATEEDGDEAIADEDEAVTEDATDEPDEDEAVTEDDDEAITEEAAEESDEDEAVAEDAAEESDEDEAVTEDEDEAADEDSTEESDEDSDEAVAEEATEEPEAAEEPVAAAEPEPARSAAGSRGSTTVADGVVTKIVVRVARQAEGVYELDEAGTSVEVEGEVATIAVTLVVEFGRAVKTLAEQIRVEVIEAVEEYLGLEVSSVDVHVADIHFPDAD